MREIAVLRVGGLCGATYEAHQHERILRRLEGTLGGLMRHAALFLVSDESVYVTGQILTVD